MTRRRDRGQAAVEFAIVCPAVIVLALGIVQVSIIATRQLALEHVARSAARAASVAADPASAASAHASSATGLAPLAVTTTVADSTVTVEVEFVDPTSVPIVGAAIGDVRLTGRATMPLEPP